MEICIITTTAQGAVCEVRKKCSREKIAKEFGIKNVENLHSYYNFVSGCGYYNIHFTEI